MMFSELWQLAPDEESYEECMSIYMDNFLRHALPRPPEVMLITQNPLSLLLTPSRQNIVAQAQQIAAELARQRDRESVKPVALYYQGVFAVLQKDLRLALEMMRESQRLNMQIYKYPSEMAILTWLPQMINFDILVLMLLLGDPLVAQCSQPNYFSDLIRQHSILLKLSPDRGQICGAM